MRTRPLNRLAPPAPGGHPGLQVSPSDNRSVTPCFRSPTWKKIWEGPTPLGTPTYVSVRDARGRRASIAFLGSTDETGLAPAKVLIEQWKLPNPHMCIIADAGSMHPRNTDSTDMMANLPQFHEWVSSILRTTAKEQPDPVPAPAAAPDLEQGLSTPNRWSIVKESIQKAQGPKVLSMAAIVRKSVEMWKAELEVVDTDVLLGDSSINNLIYMRLKEVFSALLDAAAQSGSWVLVDRTDGHGSATAENLIELALERGAARPTIVSIDSLERLGNARDGSRSHATLRQLNQLFQHEI